MSEVERFWRHEARNIRCVREADFDELSQDLRATQEHEKSLIEDFDRVTAERDALQQRLTAADERADVLEGLLREVSAEARHPDYDWNLGTQKAIDAAFKPAEGGGDYRKSCEAAHRALSMENQRIVTPGQFKCLACGDVHSGSGNLPCPKMSPMA